MKNLIHAKIALLIFLSPVFASDSSLDLIQEYSLSGIKSIKTLNCGFSDDGIINFYLASQKNISLISKESSEENCKNIRYDSSIWSKYFINKESNFKKNSLLT